jgi:hypothetical protein
MPLLGQASGGFTESSSALRLLYAGVRNSVGVLTDDSFTQTNPPVVATNISAQVDQNVNGVLSGSVCFARPDAGSNRVGGPGDQAAIAAAPAQAVGYAPLGCFINTATGNAYENLPGQASGKGPYMSSQGTYGNGLFETVLIDDTGDAVNAGAGTAITYIVGQELMASLNGYLMPKVVLGTDGNLDDADLAALSAEQAVKGAVPGFSVSTTIGIVKMPPDSVQNEVVYDQRI